MTDSQQCNLSPSRAEEFLAGEDALTATPGGQPGTFQPLTSADDGLVRPGVGGPSRGALLAGREFDHGAECRLSKPPVAPDVAEIERFWSEGRAAYPPEPATLLPNHVRLKLPGQGCCDGVDVPGVGLVHSFDCSEAHRSYLKLPGQGCCDGVDVPGVGLVHSFDCSETGRSILSGARPYQRGEMPATLRSFLDGESDGQVLIVDEQDRLQVRAASPANGHREKLLCRLLFAARRLAAQNLVGLVARQCRECQMTELGGRIDHAPSCRTGEVLAILDALQAAGGSDLDSTTLNRKETAAEGTLSASRAGAGNRQRGLADRECGKCGRVGGHWDAQSRPEVEIEMSTLAPNQCVGAGLAGEGHILYTHRCLEGGAR